MSVIASVKPYLKYSLELTAHVPIMAYYCKLYAVQKGFDLIKADTSGADTTNAKKYLMNELGEVEKLKPALEGQPKEDLFCVVENFVLSMFTKCEKEERTCETITKTNAQDFNRCNHFIALLTLFNDGELEEHWV